MHIVRPLRRSGATGRSSASAPRRWRSGASRACSTRSTRSSRSWGRAPAAFVRRFDPAAPHPELRAMVHRWTRGVDIVALLWVLRQMLDGPDRSRRSSSTGTIRRATGRRRRRSTASRRARWRSTSGASTAGVPTRPGVCYFFPRPSAGSACKRLNLFLRWMVRRDEVDLGVWTRVPPAQADRAARHARHPPRAVPAADALRQPGWRMAADITASLRALDPGDPVRFDFSLCHVGMMNACGFGRRQGDAQCPLKGLCRPRVAPRAALRLIAAFAPRRRARRRGCAPRDGACDRCHAAPW